MHSKGEGIITWIQDDPGKPFAGLRLASKDLVSPPAFPDADMMSDAEGTGTVEALGRAAEGSVVRAKGLLVVGALLPEG